MCSVIALAMFSLLAAPPPPADAAPVNACQQLEQACVNGGYVRGGNPPRGKALQENCMTPILRGDVVEGVKIDARLVPPCADERSNKRKRPTPGLTPPAPT